ncbi:MAG TPA: DUF4178 domain-containing protein [Ohtaekwangia sp.]|nr:DUF4178 domain-containing protein [Ohtaekwangia sp.]
MNGNRYQIICPKCGSVNPVRGKAMTLALTCNACSIYFHAGSWDEKLIEFNHKEESVLPIGSRGKIENFTYQVMGFVVKEELKYRYRWREYLLFNPYRGYAFLSESDGHWNLVWPIEDDPKSNASDSNFNYEGLEFKIFQRYSAHVVYAKGEFFFDVSDITESTINYEYIAPPFLLALEKSDDSILWCKGEYFSPNEIAEAFSIPKSKLPARSGIGYTQSFPTPFREGALISLSVFIFLIAFALQVFINNAAEDKQVYHGEFRRSDLKDQKMFVTPAFDLNDGKKSLEVYLEAPIVNDWFFGEFTLVNETDGTEYNFTKELEYYQGYEDGTSWNEGSTHAEAFLSQIPEGRYHLNIYPDFGAANDQFAIIISRDAPMQSNFYITALALLIYPIFFFARKRYREQRRWRDSEYSPYETK